MKNVSWHCCIIFLCFLIASCGKIEPNLRVGTNSWPGYESLYLAHHIGAFRNHPIHIIQLPSASEVIHALRSGTLEAAALTLDEALTVLEAGVDVKVVTVLDISNGGDVIITEPKIKAIGDLKGKRVGYENTAVGAIMLSALLEHSPLDLNDLRLTPIPVNEHFNAFQSGEVDALVTFEPVRSLLLAQGARIIFDSSQIPNRIIDVLVVTQNTYHSNKKSLKALVTGHFKAIDYIHKHPDKAYQFMGPRLGVEVKNMPDVFNGIDIPTVRKNHDLLTGKPSALEKTSQMLADLMLKEHLLKQKVNVTNLTDDSLLPTASH